MKKLKILYKKIGREPVVMEIEDTLEKKQELVGGLIEVIPYNDKLIVCNEEGKIMNLKPNVIFDYDYIAGNFFVVNDDYKNAGFKSLKNYEIEEIKKDLNKYSVKYNQNEMKEIIEDEDSNVLEFYKDYEEELIFNKETHCYEEIEDER